MRKSSLFSSFRITKINKKHVINLKTIYHCDLQLYSFTQRKFLVRNDSIVGHFYGN